MAITKETISELENILNASAEGLSKTTSKKMFGCHALFANENVFALVWKHGRIGVKLTETTEFDKLMSLKGSEPWKAGPMRMSHWVLVPESFNSQRKLLAPWVKLAHAQALNASPKNKSPKAKKKKDKHA